MYRIGVKLEAGSGMSLADMRGAPVLVTYQMSEAAVIPETRCISGMRLEMMSEGSMFKEMHGPERGVSRRRIQSEVMCEGVCPEMDLASGCVSQSLVKACDLRVFETLSQFLQWDSGQIRLSATEPNGQITCRLLR